MILFFLLLLTALALGIAGELGKKEPYPALTGECPGCRREVESDWLLCPHCRQLLRAACAGCGRPQPLLHAFCPWCGKPRESTVA